jgi:hypothetical protein
MMWTMNWLAIELVQYFVLMDEEHRFLLFHF